MTIAAVTCVRDEADVIEEWIAHHLALGIERIHIFDNMSEDTTRPKIEAIARQVPGVTVQSWNPPTEPQKAAYARGLDMMRAESIEWCAFLDADEFIGDGRAARAGAESFETFLGRHATHSAIGLNWALFGSSGRVERPEGLMQEAFLRRADDGFSVHRHIKSVVRPKDTLGVYHAHGFEVSSPYVNAEGEEIVWRREEYGSPVVPFAYTETAPVLDGWRVNHYFCRWRGRWDEKIRLSRLRDVFWRSEADWVHHDRNEVFDESALSWTGYDRAMLERFGIRQIRSGPALTGAEGS
jgi:glycosyltransferase involved in cell wall biosynthesis